MEERDTVAGMPEQREVVVLSGVRTPVGRYGGSLKDFTPTDLAGMVVREAVKRSGLEPDEIEQSCSATSSTRKARDMYLGRDRRRSRPACRSRPRR